MRKGSVILFYVMVAYMFISFSWWTILLLEKNREVFVEERNFLELKNSIKNNTDADFENSSAYEILLKKYESQKRMILSEAVVMMMLLLTGTFQLYRTFSKEIELNRRQKNFLLSITHELKSPLSSTKLSLQTLLKRNKLDDDKYFKLINNSLNDVERLKILVDNLLLSARIEDHSYQPSFELCNISAITEEIFSKSKEVHSLNKRIDFSIQPGLMVNGDTLAFQTIINNLIDNAIKYTADGASIHCHLFEDLNEVIITVSDNGYGIPQEEKQKIFSKFYRVGNEETRSTTGTGLGLYMVKELLKLLKGKIYVNDNSPKGTVFKISLPKAQLN